MLEAILEGPSWRPSWEPSWGHLGSGVKFRVVSHAARVGGLLCMCVSQSCEQKRRSSNHESHDKIVVDILVAMLDKTHVISKCTC